MASDGRAAVYGVMLMLLMVFGFATKLATARCDPAGNRVSAAVQITCNQCDCIRAFPPYCYCSDMNDVCPSTCHDCRTTSKGKWVCADKIYPSQCKHRQT